MPGNTEKLAVIMPAFNAAKTAAKTIERLHSVRNALPPFKIFLVDDGSEDKTSEKFLETAGKLKLDLRILSHPQNRGYGASQKTGFTNALEEGREYFLLLHSDGQYAPEESPAMLKPLLEKKTDVVLGSRLLSGRALSRGMPASRYAANLFFTKLENRVFGLDFAEYNSGYMAYSRQALEAIKFKTLTDKFHFDGEMLLCAGKLGLKVAQVPVSAYYGKETSSLSALPYISEIVSAMVKYLRGRYYFQSSGKIL